MQVILQELKNFSKQNWWIFILLIAALIIVYITGRGSLTEILLLFLANFIGNLFIMVMQVNYTAKKNKIGGIYHIIATLTFSTISIYGFIYLGQSQYILWQITYLAAAIKAFTFYNLNKNLSLINEYTLIITNIILFGIFVNVFEYQVFSVLQAIGFSLITTGLVSTRDKVRYWLSIVGILLLTSGSLIGVITSFNAGNLDGIALGYFILTGTVLVFYTKLLPTYLKKNA